MLFLACHTCRWCKRKSPKKDAQYQAPRLTDSFCPGRAVLTCGRQLGAGRDKISKRKFLGCIAHCLVLTSSH